MCTIRVSVSVREASLSKLHTSCRFFFLKLITKLEQYDSGRHTVCGAYDSNLVTYEILMYVCVISCHTHIHTHVHTGRPSSASSHASSSRMQDNLDTESCSSHDSTGNYLHMLLIYLAPILGSKFSIPCTHTRFKVQYGL